MRQFKKKSIFLDLTNPKAGREPGFWAKFFEPLSGATGPSVEIDTEYLNWPPGVDALWTILISHYYSYSGAEEKLNDD